MSTEFHVFFFSRKWMENAFPYPFHTPLSRWLTDHEEKLDSLSAEKARLESNLSRLPSSVRMTGKFSSGIVSRQVSFFLCSGQIVSICQEFVICFTVN